MVSKHVETQSGQTSLGTNPEKSLSTAPQRPGRQSRQGPLAQETAQENFADYVAELQLHMTLQAKNLVPSMESGQTSQSRATLLHETQALVEKQISRQV